MISDSRSQVSKEMESAIECYMPERKKNMCSQHI